MLDPEDELKLDETIQQARGELQEKTTALETLQQSLKENEKTIVNLHKEKIQKEIRIKLLSEWAIKQEQIIGQKKVKIRHLQHYARDLLTDRQRSNSEGKITYNSFKSENKQEEKKEDPASQNERNISDIENYISEA